MDGFFAGEGLSPLTTVTVRTDEYMFRSSKLAGSLLETACTITLGKIAFGFYHGGYIWTYLVDRIGDRLIASLTSFFF